MTGETVGVECGRCAGPVYFETCGRDGCEYATASECQRCGVRHPIVCPDHDRTPPHTPTGERT